MAKLPAFIYDSGSGDVTISLTSPLAIDNPYQKKASRKDSFSQSGVKQSAHSYIEELKEIELTFLTETERDNVLTMFDWAGQGNAIKFVPDQTIMGTYDDVTIVTKTLKFDREFPGGNYWKAKFTIRKEVS